MEHAAAARSGLSCRLALLNSSLKSLYTVRTVELHVLDDKRLYDIYLTLGNDDHARVYARSLSDASLFHCVLDSGSLAKVISESDAFDCDAQLMLEWVASSIGNERVYCKCISATQDKLVVRLTTGERDMMQPVLTLVPCVSMADLLPLLDLQALMIRQARAQLLARGVTTGVGHYCLKGAQQSALAAGLQDAEEPGTGRSHVSSTSSHRGGASARGPDASQGPQAHITSSTGTPAGAAGISAGSQEVGGTWMSQGTGTVPNAGILPVLQPPPIQGGQSSLGAGVKRKKVMLR